MMRTRSLCIRGEKCLPLTHKSRLNCAVLHHAVLSSEQIAERAQVKHARLLAYASESQTDQVPFLKLLAVAQVTERWDLVDDALAQYRRRTVTSAVVVNTDNPLDAAVDVTAIAAQALTAVRDLRRGGFDASERVQLRDLVRMIRTEVDELSQSIEVTP